MGRVLLELYAPQARKARVYMHMFYMSLLVHMQPHCLLDLHIHTYRHTYMRPHIHRYAALEAFVIWGLGAGLGPGYPVDLHSFWHSQ